MQPQRNHNQQNKRRLIFHSIWKHFVNVHRTTRHAEPRMQ